MKKFWSCLVLGCLVALTAILSVACGTDPKKSLAIAEEEISLTAGDEYTLDYSFEGMTAEDLEWTSETEAVAKVSGGKVTAVAAGETIVKVSFGDLSDSVKVKVSEKTVRYFDLGIQSANMRVAETLELNPFVYDNGSYKEVEAAFTVTGDAVVIENGCVRAVSAGTAVISGSCTYDGEEFTEQATITVGETSPYAALTDAEGKNINVNISLKAGKPLGEQLGVYVYDDDGVKKYSLEFSGSENLTIGESEKTLNSRFNLMVDGEKKGEATIALYADGDNATEDVIDENGIVLYTVNYNYGIVFKNVTIGETQYEAFIKDNMKVNVVPQNSLYDLASIRTSQIKTDFTANTGTEVSLSSAVKYRNANTIRFNTLGQWYPAINFDGVAKALKENYAESKVTFSFKVYFDRDYTGNIVFLCGFKRDLLIPEGSVKPREWTEIKIELTEDELRNLDKMQFLVQMYSNEKITGDDYSIYFADINLGAVVYSVKSLEFEKSEYSVSDAHDFNVLINDKLCAATDERIVAAEYTIDKNIAYVSEGKIYAVRKGEATLTLTSGSVNCQTTIKVDNLPNGDYHFANAFAGKKKDYFKTIHGNNYTESEGCAYVQLADESQWLDDGNGHKTPAMEYGEYVTTWYARYLQLVGYNDSLTTGKYVKISLKHDYRGEYAFSARSYWNTDARAYEFFDETLIDKKDGLITVYLSIERMSDADFGFQFIDSEASAKVISYIYSIEVTDTLGHTDNGLYSFGDMNSVKLNEEFAGKGGTTFSVMKDDEYGAVLKVASATAQPYTRAFVMKNLHRGADSSKTGQYVHIKVKFDKISASGIYAYSYESTGYVFCNKKIDIVAEQGKWVDVYLPIMDSPKADNWSIEFFDDGQKSGDLYTGLTCYIAVIEITDDFGATDNGLYSFGDMSIEKLNEEFEGKGGTTFSVMKDDDYGAVLKVTSMTAQPYTRALVIKNLHKNATSGQYVHIKVKFDTISASGIYAYSYESPGGYIFCSQKVDINAVQGEWTDVYLLVNASPKVDNWSIEFFDDGQKSGDLYTGLTCYIAEIDVVDSIA